MASRRTFLAAGVGASLTLALGGGIYRATQVAMAVPLQQHFALGGEARKALAAIAPALLAGAVGPGPSGAAAVAAVIERVHQAILRLTPAARREVQNLFGLLALAPARRLLTGISGAWANAAPPDVHAFLQDWRDSSFALLRAAYGALHDMVLGAWYAAPDSWDAIGYPGPTLKWAP